MAVWIFRPVKRVDERAMGTGAVCTPRDRFPSSPTPFVVRLAGAKERYACCAMDALGIAPMVGEPLEITSSCHHCGEPLKFVATPHGVGLDAEGLMVWFGKRGDEGCKAFDSL